MDVSSFAKRRPPKFAEPLDWDKLSPPFDSSSTSTTLGNDFSYASLYDRLFQNGPSSSNTTTSTSDWQNLDSRTLNYAASSLLSPMFSNSTFANNNGYTGNTFGQFGRSTPNSITNGSNNNPANGSIGNSDIAGSSATSPFTNGIASSLNYSNPNQNNSFTPDPWGQYAPRSCPPIGSRDTLGFGQFTMGVANSNQGNQSTYVPPRVRRRQPTCTECVFCKNNGQPPSFYKSHILKDPEGNTLCPILRRYNCPICHNNGGNRAHTLRYCPKNKPLFWQTSRP